MTRVLVVDDSRSARMIFVRCLKIAGFEDAEFLEAGEGREALEVLATRGPVDLALIDLNMPAMDGFALLKHLKQDPVGRRFPVIVASSRVNDAVRLRLREDGAHAVIEKPLSPISLKVALAGIVEGLRMTASTRLDESLDLAMARCFEGMAFTQLVRRPDASELPKDPDETVWARIEIQDPPLGCLMLAVDSSVAERLERGVLGGAAGIGPEPCEMLGELLNAIAGCWVRLLEPGANDLRFGLPVTGRGRLSPQSHVEIATYETDEQETVQVVRLGSWS